MSIRHNLFSFASSLDHAQIKRTIYSVGIAGNQLSRLLQLQARQTQDKEPRPSRSTQR